jgi:hypothetical protein
MIFLFFLSKLDIFLSLSEITKRNLMIQLIDNLPANMVGFRATGEVNKNDFNAVVIPHVKAVVEKTGKLNYLLLLDTSVKNLTFGAWIKDALLGIKNLTKWNRAAIVSDSAMIRKFTDIFSVLIPGEFKGFEYNDLKQAIDWTAEKM